MAELSKKERQAIATAKWRAKNPERVREAQKRYWEAHPGKANEYKAKDRLLNPDRVKEEKKRDYQKHRAARMAKSSKYAAENKPAAHTRHLRRTYGEHAPEHFHERVVAQLGRCAICDEPSDLVLDHEHGTGKLRGLLCGGCNLAIGIFSENSDRLERAISYLKEWK